MNLSFIIVTNGLKKVELELQKRSIQSLSIDNYEIVIVGDWKKQKGIKYIPAKELTDARLLGALRNKACEKAQYERLVISDDDMLFDPAWYKELLAGEDADIITPRVRLPDGGRFWDNTCYQSPTFGHCILDVGEEDDHLYMSGGQSWVMKEKVFDKVKWGEEFDMAGGKNAMSSLADYKAGRHNEDTDYALHCRENNFKIKHNRRMVTWHNDDTYTTSGRYARRRQNDRTSSWVKALDLNFPPQTLANLARSFFATGFQAEGMDIVRHSLQNNFKNPLLVDTLSEFDMTNGGRLSDVEYRAGGCKDYLTLIKDLKK